MKYELFTTNEIAHHALSIICEWEKAASNSKSKHVRLDTYALARLHRDISELYHRSDNFLDDEEKMVDFRLLNKEEFLASYSYLTEDEYENTRRLYDNERANKGMEEGTY